MLPLLAATAAATAPNAAASAAPVSFGHAFTADQVMQSYMYVFYVAYLVAYVFTPIMRAVAIYYGIIDEPDNLRKLHAKPVAYLGGVAVFLGWIAGLASTQFLQVHGNDIAIPPHLRIDFSLIVGATLIVVLGLWDDLAGINPWAKIVGQLIAATILLLFGIGTHCAKPMFIPINIRLQAYFGFHVPEIAVTAVSCAIVYFIVVGCCNATNLMDGLDGLCGGVTAVIAAGLLFLAIAIARSSGGLNTNLDGTRVVLGLALLGAVLGFVPFNFNPASIFMGDAGSMFLGFACATMIILSAQDAHPKWFLASLVVFSLPVLDTALAFARRYVNRRPIFAADRHHFHHQIVARGFSVKQTVMISYGLALFFALAGGAVVFMRTRYAVAFYLVIFGSLIVTAYKMGMVHERPRIVTRKPLGGGFDQIDPSSANPVEPDKVLEIREEVRQ